MKIVSDEQKETKAGDIGNVFALLDEKKLVGIEIEFNGNLTGAHTAADVLNVMGGQMHNPHWTTKTIMKVANRDAQINSERDQSGDTGDTSVETSEPDDNAE